MFKRGFFNKLYLIRFNKQRVEGIWELLKEGRIVVWEKFLVEKYPCEMQEQQGERRQVEDETEGQTVCPFYLW